MAKLNWDALRSCRNGIEVDPFLDYDRKKRYVLAEESEPDSVHATNKRSRSAKQRPSGKLKKPSVQIKRNQPMKFRGSFEDLKAVVKSSGARGTWNPGGSGGNTFLSFDGGIINWWPTGTIQFQGNVDGRLRLERLVLKILQAA